MFKYTFCCLCLFLSSITFGQQTVGLFQNDSTAFNGYTLLFPTGAEETWLIDNCGHIVHQWSSAYRPGLSVYLLDNGDLLRTARITSDFNAGGTAGRLQRLDWESNVLWEWTYSGPKEHSHHDVELLPNGNILMIAWEAVTSTAAINAGRDPSTLTGSLWPDHIIEIEPVGTDDANIVWEWHVWDHLIQDFDATKPNFGVVADHPEKINLNYVTGAASGEDWQHMNSVDYNEDLDQIVLSLRHWNEIWIIDHSTTTAEAAGSTGGNSGKGGDLLYRWGNPSTYDRGTPFSQQLYGQHDANWITEGDDEGKILIFNNGIGLPGDDFSSVVVIDPPLEPDGNYTINATDPFGPVVPEWVYQDLTDPTDFYSTNVSGAQRLPNGNTLICEGARGRIFEVDRDFKLHWEYISPVGFSGPVTQGSPASGNAVFRAYRYAPDYSAFDGRDLTPGPVIEINPLPDECQIYEEPITSTGTPEPLPGLRVFPNPVSEVFWLENIEGLELNIEIRNATGALMRVVNSTDRLIQFDIPEFEPGLYFLQIRNTSSNPNPVSSWKIIVS